MYSIKVQFESFSNVYLAELIGAVGVYVIWDAHAKARPTYVGEGNILKRFSDHTARDDRRFAKPWDGYVGIIRGSTPGVRKYESLAVERLLLDVARDTDRLPRVNRHPGSAAAVLNFCRAETLRVAVSGFDPLVPPHEARPLTRKKEIKAWVGDREPYDLDHNWRLRKLRGAVV